MFKTFSAGISALTLHIIIFFSLKKATSQAGKEATF